MDLDALKRESLEWLGLALTDEKLGLLGEYGRLLLEWNQRLNLTALRTPEEVRVLHFLDSLACFKVIKNKGPSLVDVGTGAGFPGMVLKIVDPEMRLTLVESVAKKARFCETVAEQLGLDGVEVLSRRAEDLGQDLNYRERFDWAVARAVAPMPVLAEYLLPLVRPGGRVLAMKGPAGVEETKQAEDAIKLLGGTTGEAERVPLPGLDEPRTLVMLEKTSPTPQKYPRRAGMPAKKPLGS